MLPSLVDTNHKYDVLLGFLSPLPSAFSRVALAPYASGSLMCILMHAGLQNIRRLKASNHEVAAPHEIGAGPGREFDADRTPRRYPGYLSLSTDEPGGSDGGRQGGRQGGLVALVQLAPPATEPGMRVSGAGAGAGSAVSYSYQQQQ